jgi:hypothetical protein
MASHAVFFDLTAPGNGLRTYLSAAPTILRLSTLYPGQHYAPQFDLYIEVSRHVSGGLMAASLGGGACKGVGSDIQGGRPPAGSHVKPRE